MIPFDRNNAYVQQFYQLWKDLERPIDLANLSQISEEQRDVLSAVLETHLASNQHCRLYYGGERFNYITVNNKELRARLYHGDTPGFILKFQHVEGRRYYIFNAAYGDGLISKSYLSIQNNRLDFTLLDESDWVHLREEAINLDAPESISDIQLECLRRFFNEEWKLTDAPKRNVSCDQNYSYILNNEIVSFKFERSVRFVRRKSEHSDGYRIHYLETELGAGAFGKVYGNRLVFKCNDEAISMVQRPPEKGYAFKKMDYTKSSARKLAHKEKKQFYAVNQPDRNKSPKRSIVDRAKQTITIIMPWLQGADLKDYFLEARNDQGLIAISLAEKALIAHECLKSLVHLKNAKLAHHDLKPANLFYSPGRQVSLIDFGLALPKRNLSKYRGSGTPLFLPPEARDENRNHLSKLSAIDSFSMGIILAELFNASDCTAERRGETDKRKRNLRELNFQNVGLGMSLSDSDQRQFRELFEAMSHFDHNQRLAPQDSLQRFNQLSRGLFIAYRAELKALQAFLEEMPVKFNQLSLMQELSGFVHDFLSEFAALPEKLDTEHYQKMHQSNEAIRQKMVAIENEGLFLFKPFFDKLPADNTRVLDEVHAPIPATSCNP